MKRYKHDLTAVTAASLQVVADFSFVRDRVQFILQNTRMDVNNPSKQDKTEDAVKEVLILCNKWINSKEPFNIIDP